MTTKRTINLVIYTLALAWVIMARLAWGSGDITTAALFRLSLIPAGIAGGCCAINWLLDRSELARTRGFEVKTDEKTRI